jgi:hypothetical protein
MFKILCITIILFPALLAAQPNGTEEHALEILNNWNRLESKFINKAREKLLISISEDTILSNVFFHDDSSMYKKLTIHVNPILKLNSVAFNYSFKEDICKYFVFDTINFDCTAGFYLDDKLCFVIITRGHNECDSWPSSPGVTLPEWCKGNFFIRQYYYKYIDNEDCLQPQFGIIKDSSLVFFVDGIDEGFIIMEESSEIIIYSDRNYPYTGKLSTLLNKPTEFIKECYTEKWIRYCARECPAGGKKPTSKSWWMFWEWF